MKLAIKRARLQFRRRLLSPAVLSACDGTPPVNGGFVLSSVLAVTSLTLLAGCTSTHPQVSEDDALTGKADTPGSCPSPMDATGDDSTLFGKYAWDGTTCVEVRGECSGADCDRLFDTLSACRDAVEACAADPCEPMQAAGSGDVLFTQGYAWDGSDCVSVDGQTCDGSDCDRIYATVDACIMATESCSPIAGCVPMIASGDEQCLYTHGYAWATTADGTVACVEVRGCGCQGRHCDDLFATIPDCEAASAHCE